MGNEEEQILMIWLVFKVKRLRAWQINAELMLDATLKVI
jgi:hypothetical protein